MRRLPFGLGGLSIGLAIFACSSFSSQPAATVDDADGGETTPDGGLVMDAGDAPEPFCDPDAGDFFCWSFDVDGGNPQEELVHTPTSLVTYPVGANTTTRLIDIDGGGGARGTPPHAAAFAVAPDGGVQTTAVLELPLANTDHIDCSFDIRVESAPGTLGMDIVHAYSSPSDAGKFSRSPKIVVDVQTSGFKAELRTDTGSEAILLGTFAAGTFHRFRLAVSNNGTVTGSFDGKAGATTIDLGSDATLQKLDVGVSRAASATVLVDDIRCRN